jgi:hypothetical protein
MLKNALRAAGWVAISAQSKQSATRSRNSFTEAMLFSDQGEGSIFLGDSRHFVSATLGWRPRSFRADQNMPPVAGVARFITGPIPREMAGKSQAA